MASASDASVQQKKNPDEVVKWNEYEALRDHLKLRVEQSVESMQEDLQCVELKIEGAATQESVEALTRQIADLTALVQQRPPQVNDNASVHDGADIHADGHEEFPLGGGRGGRGHAASPGRGFHAIGARRFPQPENNCEEDGLGKPNFLFHHSVLIPMMWKSTSLGN